MGEQTCSLYSECPFAMGLTRLGDLTLGSPLGRRLTLYVNNEAKLAIFMAWFSSGIETNPREQLGNLTCNPIFSLLEKILFYQPLYNPRILSLYLKAPSHMKDALVNWRDLPLVTCKPSTIQTKNLWYFRLVKVCSHGSPIIFRPMPLGYHPQG